MCAKGALTPLFSLLVATAVLPCDRPAILISLFQVIRALGLTLDLHLPPVYSIILDWLNIDELRMGSFIPLECIFQDVDAFHVTLFASTALPLAFVLLLTALHFAFARKKLERSAELCVTIGFWFIFLVYTSITSTIFQAFVCYNVADGTRMLRADLTIDCNTAAHFRAMIYAVVMILVYPVGVFSLYAAILFKNRRNLIRGGHHYRLQQVLIETHTRGRAPSPELQHATRVMSRSELTPFACAQASATAQALMEMRRSLQCSSEEPTSTTASSGASISPQLASHQEILNSLSGPIVKKLVQPYKLSCWYFELVELARKVAAKPDAHLVHLSPSLLPTPQILPKWQVAIVGLPSFFSPGSSEQLIITALITFLAVVIFTQINPYHTRSVSIVKQQCLRVLPCWWTPLLTRNFLRV